LNFSDSIDPDIKTDYLYIIPDNAGQAMREEVSSINQTFGIEAKALSCYWLYMSAQFTYSLPIDVFTQFRSKD
jgi:hypothetical protein